MSEFKPNKEQLEFINSNNFNVLVSASAGSGKTSTMIQKLLAILSIEKVPITSLLVVTYTNASASEMKQKLYNEISNLLLDTTDVDLKLFLKSQLENINNAEIGTLHSICKKLIVKYFYELEQSPDFNLLSERDAKYLLDTAIKKVFSTHITSNDEAFYELYDCYNTKRNDTTLKDMCLQLYNYMITKNDYISWKNSFLCNSYNIDLNSNIACNFVFNYYKQVLDSYKSVINKLLIEGNSLNLEKYINFLNTRLQFIDEFVSAKTFEQSLKILFDRVLLIKPTKSRNASTEELDFDESVDEFNKSFSDLIKRIKKDYVCENVADLKENINSAKSNLIKIFEIVEEIKKTYAELKKSNNYLDFNDLEDKMQDLLENEQIRKTLSEHYKYVFVDEYQDINEKQENILLKLVSNDNYYMIGDVKQSIYAFRQSSPKIFISKFQEFSKDGLKNKVINFNTNYRSDKNILEFNNYIFDELITENTIGINYKDTARFVSNNPYNGSRVNLNIINTGDIVVDKERAEAMLVAKEISNLLLKEKKDGTKITYKDIAIIVRQRGTFVKVLYETLTKLQIPVSTSINNDFFNTSEIKLMISILKVISNYKDDLAIATVLKNLFGVNESELLAIRNFAEYKNFYECVINYSSDGAIKTKLDKFFEFVNLSQLDLCNMTLYDFLHNTINKFDMLSNLKSLPNGIEKENNINEFLSLTDAETYKYNLDRFLEYLDFISKESVLQVVGKGGNSVQICTIHYSKGLEYPAVIMAGLGKQFQLNKGASNIIINNQFGVGLKSIDSKKRILSETLIRNACKIENKTSQIDEEIRLLYVAMTRPKEYLSLIGQYDILALKSSKYKTIYNSKNFLDMLFKTIDKKYISYFINKSEFKINEGNENEFRVNVINIDDIELSQVENQKDIILNAENVDLMNALSNVYNKRPSSKIYTIKNTVTNILQEESDYENLNYMPKNLDLSDEVVSKDYLKIGTAYHAVMQNLNFTENKEQISVVIENLKASNVISEDIIKEIDIDEIFTACQVLRGIAKDAKEIFHEKQFLMQENYNKLVKNSDNNTKVIIQGIIDLVVVKGNEAILIDFKTNRTKDEQKIVEQYKLQLEIYKLAFEKATNIEITKKYLYSFYLGKLIEI